MPKPKTLILIVGPTCSSKSKAAFQLATYFDTEIISADSRKIYKEMRIGTAIPPKRYLSQRTYHFIQNISIKQYYNAYQYQKEALGILKTIFQHKNIAVAVGGSMLYIDALCYGIDDMPTIDQQLRKNLKEKYEKEGLYSIQKMLKTLDKDYYKLVDLKNPKRLLHALEVCVMTGKTYSSLRKKTLPSYNFSILKIGVKIKRDNLYEAINRRVDKMIENGLEKEAHNLFPFRDKQALNTIGYKEFFDFFQQKISFEKTVELIKRNTRRYAKRQHTWFKKDASIKWFPSDSVEPIIKYVEGKLKKKLKNINS